MSLTGNPCTRARMNAKCPALSFRSRAERFGAAGAASGFAKSAGVTSATVWIALSSGAASAHVDNHYVDWETRFCRAFLRLLIMRVINMRMAGGAARRHALATHHITRLPAQLGGNL